MDNPKGSLFKDFIPDGEDTGAITKSGYQDFVPAPEPHHQTINEQQVKEEDKPIPSDFIAEPEEPAYEQTEPDTIVPPLEGGKE